MFFPSLAEEFNYKRLPDVKQKFARKRWFPMGHKFLVAAYCVTWAIQFGYILWMAVKWTGQRSKLKIGAGR
jgi:hypothetical protein